MARIPKKVSERLRKAVPRFQKVLEMARDRDVNEADTVTIITDILSEVFGFDKYQDITSEQAIRGTYCDLAVTTDGKIRYLLEVKAIGLDLKENHLRQAVSYGATEGIPWVILTNGVQWDLYRIRFEQPIGHDLVCSFNFLELNGRKTEDQHLLYIYTKEGLAKSAIDEFHEHVQVVNRFVLAAMFRSEAVLKVLRREFRRLAPGVKVGDSEIRDLLPDVLKRDLLESERAKRAQAKVERAAKKNIRKRPASKKKSQSDSTMAGFSPAD